MSGISGKGLHAVDWRGLAKRLRYCVRSIAAACKLSIRQLQRHFQAIFQTTPRQWLNELRLADAAQMLLQGEDLKIVAYNTGYNDSSHLCRRFKQRFGLTPMNYVRAASAQKIDVNVAPVL